MEMITERIFQILIGAVIVEHLLAGLHSNYWTAKIIERVLEIIEIKGKIGGALYEYLSCKFCQSWAVGWAVAGAVILWCGSWSWDWIWMGIVMSSGSNIVHGLKDWVKVAKYGPFNGNIVVAKKEER